MGLIALLQSFGSVSGQTPTGGSSAATGPAPKTAWGHPDLQGIWLDEFENPLQRPARHADKEFFTDKERADQDAVPPLRVS